MFPVLSDKRHIYNFSREVGFPDPYTDLVLTFCNMFENIAEAYAYFQCRTESSACYLAYNIVTIDYIIISPGKSIINHFESNKFSL